MFTVACFIVSTRSANTLQYALDALFVGIHSRLCSPSIGNNLPTGVCSRYECWLLHMCVLHCAKLHCMHSNSNTSGLKRNRLNAPTGRPRDGENLKDQSTDSVTDMKNSFLMLVGAKKSTLWDYMKWKAEQYRKSRTETQLKAIKWLRAWRTIFIMFCAPWVDAKVYWTTGISVREVWP